MASDDLTKLWAGRDRRTGEIHPHLRMDWRSPAEYPWVRAETRADLPMERREPLKSITSPGTGYQPQDFPNPDFSWSNPTQAEYDQWMARYRDDVSADNRRARNRAINSVLTVVFFPVLLPLAILAKITRWATS